MGRTLGELAEIARTAWLKCDLNEDHWAAAVKAVRSQVIEEAIEALRKRRWSNRSFGGAQTTRERTAAAIAIEGDIEALTALKDKADEAH